MDKIKKLLTIPVVCHAVAIIALVVLYHMQNSAAMLITMLELMLGAFVAPIFMAVISLVHAIVHEGKVYDYIYTCLGYLGSIGVLRLAFYAVESRLSTSSLTVTALVALASIIVSICVFSLWSCLFALTDRLMKKRPGKR